ncbi:PD-(D/E)XK motif protein [Specibacter sp. AOP5-B1-6]|uniref:PD-(D/E)XK motif protein n=1 Tax=Specibacter sp. AOP5-B1-6 TaxID=3457653 RepID=UPI00402B4CBF
MTEHNEASSSIFEYLTAAAAAKKLTARPTTASTPLGEVVHAIDAQGFPSLMVPVAETERKGIDWQNKIITFGYRQMRIAGKDRTFLVLQCTSSRLLPQFSLLADDVLEAVSRNPNEADRATRNTLERWKEMLRDTQSKLLGEEKLVGIYGELLFLEQLTMHHGIDALSAWTGPQGMRHDFELANASFEVKTTTNHNSLTVTFHGSKQLEPTDHLPLFVVVYQIEKSVNGVSVPALLQRLYDRGLDRLEILRQVGLLGYAEEDSGHYSDKRFTELTHKALKVTQDFPQLTSYTVPPSILDQIGSLNYSVDLGPLPASDIALEELTVRVPL